MSDYLHGIHDSGGESLHADKPGWTLITEAIGTDPNNVSGANYSSLSNRGFGVIVRLNNGYGNDAGTVPLPNKFPEYAATCAAWVAKSKGATIWTISNEVNHEGERPNGVFIKPEEYAGLFTLARNAIKRVGTQHQVLPAALAPYHANPMNWLKYLRRMLEVIEYQSGCDGINIHAYTRGMNPENITSNAKMGPPLQDQYSGFRTYQDALGVVPLSMRKLRAYITEFDAYGAWENNNTSVIQAMYAEIDAWNHRPDTQKIRCSICFRWLAGINHVDWGMQNKPKLLQDFREAVQKGYKVPETFFPQIETSPIAPTAVVKTVAANIRSGPGMSYNILGEEKLNMPLPIIGRSADNSWWQVKSQHGTGWISNTVVNVVNTQNVPVVNVTIPIPQPTPVPIGDNFERCLAFVLKWEGTWADDPNDSGGATMKGITLGTYTRWRAAHGQNPPSKDELRNISDVEVSKIYREWYYLPSKANEMAWPMCLAVMDLAVNGGVGRATEALAASGNNFIRYMAWRIDWYTRLDDFIHFGRAWERRCADLMREAAKSI